MPTNYEIPKLSYHKTTFILIRSDLVFVLPTATTSKIECLLFWIIFYYVKAFISGPLFFFCMILVKLLWMFRISTKKSHRQYYIDSAAQYPMCRLYMNRTDWRFHGGLWQPPHLITPSRDSPVCANAKQSLIWVFWGLSQGRNCGPYWSMGSINPLSMAKPSHDINKINKIYDHNLKYWPVYHIKCLKFVDTPSPPEYQPGYVHT